MIQCPKCGFMNADGAQFCANSNGCGAYLGYEPKRAEPMPGTVQVTVSSATVSAAPGALATMEVRVRNKSNIVDQYTIEVVGDPAAWSVVQPSTLSLFPDKDGTAVVQLRPPRSSSVPAGTKEFSIRVQSKASPTITAAQEAAIDVAPYLEAVASITPRTARGGTAATFRVLVQNRGNAPLQLSLDASDPDDLLRFEFAQTAVTVGPGESANVQLTVRAPGVFYDGPPQPHSFKVQLSAAGLAPVAADATFMQDPVPRPVPRKFPWVPVALAFLLLAILTAGVIERDPIIRLIAGTASPSPTLAPNTGSSSTSASATNSASPSPSSSASVLAMVTVPSVTCESQQQAQQTLSNAGLTFVPVFQPSAAYPAGVVMSSNPAAGASVPRNSEVRATVSTGAPSASGIRALNPCLLLNRPSLLPISPSH